MTGRIILGLDLATHTGYSVWHVDEQRLINIGDIDCSIKTKSSKAADPLGRRFYLLRITVHSLLVEYGVTDVWHERTVGGVTAGGAPALISAGMAAIVQELAYAAGIPCDSISTGTLKKHATGNGGNDTKKQHMIAAALLQQEYSSLTRIPKRAPTKSKPWSYDDDVVDALWVGHYGVHQILGRPYKTKWDFYLVTPTQVRAISNDSSKVKLVKNILV